MLSWFEHSQVYHPAREIVATGAELGRPFDDVYFTSADRVRLNGWFYPADTHSLRACRVVLLCHGNGGNISSRLEMYRALLETGVSVFAFDYRGYGRSEGRPSEEGTYLDAQAAHEWLCEKGFAPEKIIAFGESLGGGIAVELALRATLGGVVLENSFSCTADIGAELFPWLPVRWLGRIKYETCNKLPKIRVPVMVMHSREDSLIGFHHGERNFARANEPKLFWELTGGHNHPLKDRARFLDGMEKFLQLTEQFRAARSADILSAT
jgi:uncharacterized protein